MESISRINSIIIFNSKLDVKWIDTELLSLLKLTEEDKVNLTIKRIFLLEKSSNRKFGRWLISGDNSQFSEDCEICVNDISIEIKLTVLRNEGSDIYARVKSSSIGKDEVINHWDTVIKTFPGALIILNSSCEVIEVTIEAISLLQLKNPRGVLFSRESLINKKFVNI
jgi:hypothetical protein